MERSSNPSDQQETSTIYSTLESFIEKANKNSAKELFIETRKQLAELTQGPKSSMAQKAISAIDKVEALLEELYEIRMRLEADARVSKQTRR